MRINRCILGACLLAFVLAGCSGKEASGETEVSSEIVESVETVETVETYAIIHILLK